MAKKPAKKPPHKSKRGRKPKLDQTQVAAALAELQGNVAAVAKRFNVDRSSVRDFISRTPALQKVCLDAREGMKDHAESALLRAILGGEAWAVCFYLKTQAKDRGYIERQEVESVAKTRLVIEEEIVSGNAAPQGETAPRSV